VLRLRSALRDFFPVALQAFPDLDAPDALELLRRAPDPDQAARLTRSRITAALRRVNRRDVEDKTAQLQAMLRAEQLRQPPVIQSAYAAIVTSQVAIIEALNIQIDQLGAVWARILAATRTLRSTPANPGSARSSPPGSSASSATTRAATSTPRHARATPAPHPSPVRPARRRSCSPATPATGASAMPYSNGPSARSADRPEPGRTTSSSAPATSATKPRSAKSPTALSASCTAA
jgi:hypothetical protein